MACTAKLMKEQEGKIQELQTKLTDIRAAIKKLRDEARENAKYYKNREPEPYYTFKSEERIYQRILDLMEEKEDGK